jgi:hypothetical protein
VPAGSSRRTHANWSAEAANPDGPYRERAVNPLVLPDGEALLDATGWLGSFGLLSVSGLVAVLLVVLVLTLILISFVSASARHALAWATANPTAALAVLVGVAGIIALLVARRPWLVVAQRLGLDDAPRRATLEPGVRPRAGRGDPRWPLQPGRRAVSQPRFPCRTTLSPPQQLAAASI